jgi:hypothetical protein
MFSLRGITTGSGQSWVRFFFYTFLACNLPNPVQAFDVDTYSKSPEWLHLLHYQESIWGGYSQSEGNQFYLSIEGANDPAVELRDSLAALRLKNANFECRFPARARILRKRFSSLPSQSAPCPDWDGFRSRMNAESVSVVFSSYYMNNPASAFGHTFLRLKRKATSPENANSAELLDVGISYAATVTTSNALLYAIYGTFGLFSGNFTALPYYYKVREYADSENRDLWSYELALNPDEVELLVAHLWELGQAQKRYLYFSKNCSYEILALLDAVRPNLSLIDGMPSFIIPAHTIQKLSEIPGLVRSIRYRPSSRKRVEVSFSKLSQLDQERAKSGDISSLTREHSVKVLDARIDWIDYHNFKQLIHEDKETLDLKEKTLNARASTGIANEEAPIEPPLQFEPSKGHLPRRVSISYGLQGNTEPFTELGIRGALHDFLDPAIGYPDSASIEFLNVRVRAAKAPLSKWELEELGLFRAASIQPITGLSLEPSWKVDLGLKRERIIPCRENDQTCLAMNLIAAGGGTFESQLLSMNEKYFFLGGGRITAGTRYVSNLFKATPVMIVGSLIRANESLSFLGQFHLDRFSIALSAETRFAVSNLLALGFMGQMEGEIRSWRIGAYYYF